jgi:hypothetical protein
MPIPASGRLWPGIAVDEPSRLNFPLRGPTKYAPTAAHNAPGRCSQAAPALSMRSSFCSQPCSPLVQSIATGTINPASTSELARIGQNRARSASTPGTIPVATSMAHVK